jgi:UDP-N-acetylmuramyl pentapeptide phosphotransferase/UDP-N-acetylglucosamine-1-phosphate transferase
MSGAMLAGLLGFGVALLGSGLWRALALRRGWLDRPGRRRLHVGAVPRGGGVAIALALLVATLSFLGPSFAHEDPRVVAWLGPVLAAAALGWVDDRWRPSAAIKLLGQLVVSVFASFAWSASGSAMPAGAIFLLALLFMNAWNFMDGSDGLAASQALLCAAALAVAGAMAGDGLPLGAWLVAACLGFLPWNLPVPRLFLGDSGSHALGLGVLGLLVLTRLPEVSAWLAWLLPCAFLVDAGLTLLRRACQGRRWWRPHREHLYQYAVRRGTPHARVALAYTAWTLAMALLLLGLSSRIGTVGMAVALVFGVFLVAALLHQWLRLRLLAGARAC